MNMFKILQINSVVNSGSTGRIVEEIGTTITAKGCISYIAYGRNSGSSYSKIVKIGNKLDLYFHVFITRLLDLHGFGSYFATKRLINQIEKINPDLIHLHNIHGYYINIKILFKYIKLKKIPIVWTLHDCWAFTGHCCYYSNIHCSKWKNECKKCSLKKTYPKSYVDNSNLNFNLKKDLFTGIPNLTIITPSKWLAKQVNESFLKSYAIEVINNGIDLSVFTPNQRSLINIDKLKEKKIILGVANIWDNRKGYEDFVKLSKIISNQYIIVLIGLNERQIIQLPDNILGFRKTENQEQLAMWYNSALVFFNPSVEETQGLTTIEALACGTPAIVYNCTAIPESVDDKTGFVVDKGDINSVLNCIDIINNKGKGVYEGECRNRASSLYNKGDMLKKYYELYNRVLNKDN